MPLTNDERVVLEIASRGEAMIPIGRWRQPVLSLVQRGLLTPNRHAGDPTGSANNVITAAGRAALTDATRAEYEENEKLRQIATSVDVTIANHDSLLALGEQAAKLLAQMAQQSIDPSHVALDKWVEAVRKRALELLE